MAVALIRALGFTEFPKVARQAEARAHGLPVPDGLVFEQPVQERERATLREFLRDGAVVARGAVRDEDGEAASFAGRSRTLAGLRGEDEVVAAIGELVADGVVLVQREVARRYLVVALREGEGPWLYEAHDASSPANALACSATPAHTGLLADFPEPELAHALRDLAERAEALHPGHLGVDLEMVVDPAGTPWLVQSRPLARELVFGAGEFTAAVAAEPGHPNLEGKLILDAEHNPEPLSPAHAWLMDELRIHRPGSAGDPLVLCGWLYVRTRPRDLGGAPGPSSAREVLAWLSNVELPRVRTRLAALDDALARAPEPARLLADALAIFLEMIDTYTSRILPARRAAAPYLAQAKIGSHTLAGRSEFLDVLPAAWDLESPSLADLALRARVVPEVVPSDAGGVALALGERDDHLFALGLAAVRRVFIAAAARARFPEADVFMLRGDELDRLADDPSSLQERVGDRRRLRERQAKLVPPRALENGRALPLPRAGRLGGHPIGRPVAGRVARRTDLRALVADPVEAGAVLCIPTLTAQAAVVVAEQAAAAVCTEFGGPFAHAALLARELGLSALIGCRECTSLPEGTEVLVDTRTARLVPRFR